MGISEVDTKAGFATVVSFISLAWNDPSNIKFY